MELGPWMSVGSTMCWREMLHRCKASMKDPRDGCALVATKFCWAQTVGRACGEEVEALFSSDLVGV